MLFKHPLNTATALIVLGFALYSTNVVYAQQVQPRQYPNAPAEKLSEFLDKLSDTSQATIEAATTVTSTVIDAAQDLVGNALGLLGVPYRYGGNTAAGLDCSGFVKLVFAQTLGIVLPRRADEIGKLGSVVAPDNLQPGDLVFFNTMRRVNSHVGIYIGNGEFVHAPSSGGRVRVDKLNNTYWSKHFEGGKRLTETVQTKTAEMALESTNTVESVTTNHRPRSHSRRRHHNR